MSKIKLLEQEIKSLSPEELKSFREWFIEFDSNEWDQQIKIDATNGKLDALAQETLVSHQRGESTAI